MLVGSIADATIPQSAVIIIVTLLATTPRAEMHPGSYIFTEVVNNTGWPSNGLAVALGLLSVQWTMTGESGSRVVGSRVVGFDCTPCGLRNWILLRVDQVSAGGPISGRSRTPISYDPLTLPTDYDAAAHISEEVHRAAIAAPVAIFVAVLNTGVSGFSRSNRSGFDCL